MPYLSNIKVIFKNQVFVRNTDSNKIINKIIIFLSFFFFIQIVKMGWSVSLWNIVSLVSYVSDIKLITQNPVSDR